MDLYTELSCMERVAAVVGGSYPLLGFQSLEDWVLADVQTCCCITVLPEIVH